MYQRRVISGIQTPLFINEKRGATFFLQQEERKEKEKGKKNTRVKDIYKTFILRLISGEQNISSELAYRLSDFPGITDNL